MGCNGRLFVSLDLSQSRVTSEGVLLEEYIGKYDLSLRLSFLLHFWNKLSENNNFDVKTVRKFLILREKINIKVVFVGYHLARA